MDCPRSEKKGKMQKKDKERYTDTPSISCTYSISILYAATDVKISWNFCYLLVELKKKYLEMWASLKATEVNFTLRKSREI